MRLSQGPSHYRFANDTATRHEVFTLALDDKLYLAPLPDKLEV